MLALPSFLAPAALYARFLNALLQREEWARARLYPHAGKTVRFIAGPLRISLAIESSGYIHASDPNTVPDVILTIPSEQIPTLPTLAQNRDPSELLAVLHIEGDAGLTQTVSDLARDLRWDIEHDLANRVGDLAAVRILQTGSSLLRTARLSTSNLGHNINEYLAHESRLLTSRSSFSTWTDELVRLHQRVEQLEHRVNTLAQDGRHV